MLILVRTRIDVLMRMGLPAATAGTSRVDGVVDRAVEAVRVVGVGEVVDELDAVEAVEVVGRASV